MEFLIHLFYYNFLLGGYVKVCNITQIQAIDVVISLNVGPVLIWDVNEPLRMPSTQAVPTLYASMESLAWAVNILKNTD